MNNEIRSPFDFPEKDGPYLAAFENGWQVADFYHDRGDNNVGHWFPSWGIRGWLPLPTLPSKVIRKQEAHPTTTFGQLAGGQREHI